jgi:hypothetical protein
LPINIQLSKITGLFQKPRLSTLILDSDSWVLTSCRFCGWWAWVDLNYRPRPYQGRALAT